MVMEGQRSSLVASVFFTLVLTYCRGQGIPLSCPAIPIPIPEAIIEVHQCISMMSRPVKPSEMEVVQNSLMDCAEAAQSGTGNPLVFMMVACSDGAYLDKTAYCMFDNEEDIFRKLNLNPKEKEVGDKVFKCLKDLHTKLVKKRSTR